MRAAFLDDLVNENDMELAAVPVRVYGVGSEIGHVRGLPVVGNFFLQFSEGGLFWCFSLVYNPGGEFQSDFTRSVAVLLRHDPFALGGSCQNQHPVRLP